MSLVWEVSLFGRAQARLAPISLVQPQGQIALRLSELTQIASVATAPFLHSMLLTTLFVMCGAAVTQRSIGLHPRSSGFILIRSPSTEAEKARIVAIETLTSMMGFEARLLCRSANAK